MRIQEVAPRIENDAIVQYTRELVRIPTVNPPGEYGAISGLIERRMRESGLQTVVMEGRPGKPNVFGLMAGTAANCPTILLSGHMDVVGPGERSSWRFDPFSATIADGAIWGRGTVDMKGALAAQLFAVRAVRGTVGALPVNVMLGATVDDEIAGVT
jgi:succinyl-diaminopimelate desuccinylase